MASLKVLPKFPPNLRNFVTTAPKSDAWLSKIFVRKIEPTKESHSRMLSDKEIIYALQTHNFRPDSKVAYLNTIKQTVDFIKAQNSLAAAVELVGSWTVNVGDQDQALHLWKFTGGYEKIDLFNNIISRSDDFKKISEDQGKVVRSRHLQYLLAFSYWPQIQLRKPCNIYEIRSYALKPGTMIEWGNNWARAINFRQNNDEAFAGFFSQIGRLYNVHHIWCYEDLNKRKETRESAWRSPGWDECVAYTVPLIREMHCRIMVPTEFSPTQ
ncbi:protein NipSnap [Tribolium castaneum]|uniref:Protein NipSnap-like Protein n=1 Tax=Tribolium castaneum TaxID=7070 RepID=D2A5X0_TRICA|nr:PREDICTED: protein NipSnap [Tribolium castaneum]EFA05012.1 Protein NipSnap-like Protein [Tribolium castaneum]|eukprot:XP_969410.1 PREDICTED: protein NipSnap [Tribolium castaneum]